MSATDFGFVVALGRIERRALSIIPAPSIKHRMIDPGFYVIIRDGRGHRRGFLLHGPPRWGKPLHIYQTCVETDYRLRGFAAQAVAEIARRGLQAGATEINLRCAADLPAMLFWRECGFTFRQWHVGGNQRQRVIAELFSPLTASPPVLSHRVLLTL